MYTIPQQCATPQQRQQVPLAASSGALAPRPLVSVQQQSASVPAHLRPRPVDQLGMIAHQTALKRSAAHIQQHGAPLPNPPAKRFTAARELATSEPGGAGCLPVGGFVGGSVASHTAENVAELLAIFQAQSALIAQHLSLIHI